MHIFLPGGPISPGSPGNPNPSWPRSPLGPLYPEERGDTLAENKKKARQSAALQLVWLVQIPGEQSPLNLNISPGTCMETTNLLIRYSAVKMSGFRSALVLPRTECRDGSLLLSSFDPSLFANTLTSCTEGKEKKKVIKHSICALAFKGRRRVLAELSDNRGGHGRKAFPVSQGPEVCFVGGGIQRDG